MTYDEATEEMNKLYRASLIKVFVLIPIGVVGIMVLVLNYLT